MTKLSESLITSIMAEFDKELGVNSVKGFNKLSPILQKVMVESDDRYKKFLSDAITRIEKEDKDEAYTAMDQGATCCKDKHQTFYGAIIRSPQWQAWYKEQTKRFGELRLNKKTNKYEGEPTFDIDESVGIGAIGDRHLAEFFKFVGQEAYDKGFEKGVAIGAKRGFEYKGKLDDLIFSLTKERKDK